MNIAPSMGADLMLAATPQQRQANDNNDFLNQLFKPAGQARSADAVIKEQTMNEPAITNLGFGTDTVTAQDATSSIEAAVNAVAAVIAEQLVQPAAPTSATTIPATTTEEALRNAPASSAVLPAELYQSLAYAVGRLSYQDSQLKFGTATIDGTASTPVSPTEKATRPDGDLHINARSTTQLAASSFRNTMAARQTSADTDAESAAARAVSEHQTLLHSLEPWLRRRISIVQDGNTINVLVRDFQADDQELARCVTHLITQLKQFHGRDVQQVTVNGKPWQPNPHFNAEQRHAS